MGLAKHLWDMRLAIRWAGNKLIHYEVVMQSRKEGMSLKSAKPATLAMDSKKWNTIKWKLWRSCDKNMKYWGIYLCKMSSWNIVTQKNNSRITIKAEESQHLFLRHPNKLTKKNIKENKAVKMWEALKSLHWRKDN